MSVDAKRAYLLMPCQSKEHLRDWLEVYLEYMIFDTTVSRFSTSNPLDALWEAYSFMMNPDTRTPKNFLFAAARSTQKTITVGAFDTLMALHGRRSLVHFAGSEDQVDSGYAYMKRFLAMPYIRDLVDGKVTNDGATLLVPQYDNDMWVSGKTASEIKATSPDSLRQVDIIVKSITPYTVQGLHVPGLTVDEIHTLRGEKAVAYKDIRKIPTASWDGKPWVRMGISSRKSPNSIVEKEIEDKERTGLLLRQWTVLEGIEQCPSSRSGSDFSHVRYINVYNADEKTEEDFTSYAGKDKDRYEKAVLASGCLKCPIRSVCLGDLAKPKVKNRYHQSVDAAIVDYLGDKDRGWYIAQCMSLQPSREGIVYSRFDRNTFHMTPKEMMEFVSGRPAPDTTTQEDVVKYLHSIGLKCYLGLDHGFTDPAAFVILFEDSIGRVFVVHASAVQALDPVQLKDYVAELWHKYKFTHCYPDTAQPSHNELLRKLNLFLVVDDFSKKDGIANGISYIRSKITPMIGGTAFYGLEGACDPLVSELEKYHYMSNSAGELTDVPADKNNHCCDALRYVALNRWDGSASPAYSVFDEPKKTTAQEEASSQILTQQQTWLTDKISELTGDINYGASKTSKNKGIIWDI